MRTRLVLPGLLLWAAALPAQAAVNLQFVQCVGTLQRIDEPAVSLSCEGDLMLHSGLIESSAEVSLSATKSIVLQNVNIRGQTITLQADAIVLVGNNVLDAREWPVFLSPTPPASPPIHMIRDALLTIAVPTPSPPQLASSSAPALAGIIAYGGSNSVSLIGTTLTATATEPEPEPELVAGGSMSFAWLAALALAVACLGTPRAGLARA